MTKPVTAMAVTAQSAPSFESFTWAFPPGRNGLFLARKHSYEWPIRPVIMTFSFREC
jgi:hypothetical protein